MAIVLFPSPRLYDYDQQSAPSSPTTNQTWLERNTSSVPIAEWIWNGTFWIDLYDRVVANSFSCSAGGQQALTPQAGVPRLSPERYQGFLVTRTAVELTRVSGTHDASNYYNLNIDIRGASNALRPTSFTAPFTLITTGTKTILGQNHNNFCDLINTLYTAQALFATVGSPGVLDIFAAVTTRGVRR